ncbi:MAG: CBS domain-containing protein [Kiloniellales bacterium]|nr:CBS domain-containing protein [Kiloniellales bacterium]
MNVRDIMTSNAQWVDPSTTLSDAAKRMKSEKIGILPIGENDRLIGMLSDRDIVINALAEDRDVRMTPVRDAMSANVLYVFEDQSIEDAAKSMAENQVRRMPVLDRDKRLVGMVSLGDIAGKGFPGAAGSALESIAH